MQQEVVALPIDAGVESSQVKVIFVGSSQAEAVVHPSQFAEILKLTKKTYPIVLTRLITAAVPPLIITYEMSKKGDAMLGKIALPLASLDVVYYIVIAMYGVGISQVRARFKLKDSSTIEYFLAGVGINAVATFVLATPLFLGMVYGLGITDSEVRLFLALSEIDVWLLTSKMLSRQMMVSSDFQVWKFDGADVSVMTTVLDILVFYVVLRELDPSLGWLSLVPAKVSGSLVKIGLDSIYLLISKNFFRRPRLRMVWEDAKAIVASGWKVSVQTFFELVVFLIMLPGYANVSGLVSQAAIRIALTWDSVASPFGSAWARGMQRLIAADMALSEKLAIAFRAIVMTVSIGAIPLLIGEVFTGPLTSLFTNSTAIIQESAIATRALFGGQYLYGLSSIVQTALWLLFNNTGFAMGAAVANAVLFCLVTLPLFLEDIAGFDMATLVFVGCMAINAFATMVKYIHCQRHPVEQLLGPVTPKVEEVPQGHNLKTCGIFKPCVACFERLRKGTEKQKLLDAATQTDDKSVMSVNTASAEISSTL